MSKRKEVCILPSKVRSEVTMGLQETKLKNLESAQIIEASKQGLQRVRKGEEPPPGAVKMSYEDAVVVMKKKIDTSDYLDYWALRYGYKILGGSAGLCAFMVNNLWLELFGITSGFASSVLPAVFAPMIVCTTVQQMLISNRILVGDVNCAFCMELRSSVSQFGFGVVMPTVISPLVAILGHKHLQRNKTLPTYIKEKFQKNKGYRAKYLSLTAAMWTIGGLVVERQMKHAERLHEDMLKKQSE